jgi:hypothetical protein
VRLNDGSNVKINDNTKQNFNYLPKASSNVRKISMNTLNNEPKETKLKVAILLNLLKDTLLE